MSKVRIVTVRPDWAAPSAGERSESRVAKFATSQTPLSGTSSPIAVGFGISGVKGIVIDCRIVAGNQVLELDLLESPDPFAPIELEPWDNRDGYYYALRPWLDAIEQGDLPAIVFDQEGSTDALAVLQSDGDMITLVCCRGTDGPVIRMLVARNELVKAFRDALDRLTEEYGGGHWQAAIDAMPDIRS